MRRIVMMAFPAALAVMAAGIPATATAQQEQAEQASRAEHYSVETTPCGKLIDDPAAAAILERLIPTVWGNSMFQTAGRELTLRAIQQYEPVLTEQKLAEIQAEFDKIPAKS
jgi:hypothetical protein